MITPPRLSPHRARTPSLITLLGLVSLMLLLIAVPAHAADLFSPVPGDMSMKLFVKPLFGPVIDGSSSPLSGILGAFNAGVLFLGGIFAGYTIIAGTMATAHDGELLGKKWSSMWIPVRTCHLPPYRSHRASGIKEPGRFRHKGATSFPAYRSQGRNRASRS